MTSAKVSKNEFVYSKLPPGEYIRILQLLRPKRGSDMPRASLAACPLAEAENYAAVSYAWGDPSQTRSIRINDLDFRVRENIWQFLSQARHNKSFIGASLWIDAICINQADTEEKSKQVQLMGKVYEQASIVMIWLGCGNDGTKMLFRCLEYRCWEYFKRNKGKALDLSKRFTITTRVFHRDRMPSLIKDLKAALAQALIWIFENDYWKRTWIVQECLLARERSLLVCCGKQCISLDALKNFGNLELEDGIGRQPAVQEWIRFSTLFSHGELGGRSYNPGKIVIGYADWYDELFTLLQHVQSAKCSILHDKTFGILSLVQHNPKHENIRVDYKMSLEELFLRSLACWTTGRLTIKLARQLILNLNLDLAKIRAEVQKHELLGTRMGMSVHARVPPIDCLMIRLGTVIEIQTAPAGLVPLGTPTISLRFDGPYSARLNVLGPDWLSTGSSTRSDSAVGFSLCPLELGDVIFAFFDSMACLVFRKSAPKLVKIGCAILADANNTNGSSGMNVVGEVTNISASMMQDLLQPKAFGHVEIDDSANEYEGNEYELELNSLAVMGILSCHSAKYDWPPLRCVESQRHLRTRY
jgi:hypothetical protein